MCNFRGEFRILLFYMLSSFNGTCFIHFLFGLFIFIYLTRNCSNGSCHKKRLKKWKVCCNKGIDMILSILVITKQSNGNDGISVASANVPRLWDILKRKIHRNFFYLVQNYAVNKTESFYQLFVDNTPFRVEICKKSIITRKSFIRNKCIHFLRRIDFFVQLHV